MEIGDKFIAIIKQGEYSKTLLGEERGNTAAFSGQIFTADDVTINNGHLASVDTIDVLVHSGSTLAIEHHFTTRRFKLVKI